MRQRSMFREQFRQGNAEGSGNQDENGAGVG